MTEEIINGFQNQALLDLSEGRLPVLPIVFAVCDTNEKCHWLALAQHEERLGLLLITNRRTLFLVKAGAEILIEVPHRTGEIPTSCYLASNGLVLTDPSGVYSFETMQAEFADNAFRKALDTL